MTKKTIILSRENQIKFAKALLHPPKPNGALRKAAKLHDKLIRKIYPWEERGYAIGLEESVQMALKEGRTDPSSIATYLCFEWGTNYGNPSTHAVKMELRRQRKLGFVSYTPSGQSWSLIPLHQVPMLDVDKRELERLKEYAKKPWPVSPGVSSRGYNRLG